MNATSPRSPGHRLRSVASQCNNASAEEGLKMELNSVVGQEERAKDPARVRVERPCFREPRHAARPLRRDPPCPARSRSGRPQDVSVLAPLDRDRAAGHLVICDRSAEDPVCPGESTISVGRSRRCGSARCGVLRRDRREQPDAQPRDLRGVAGPVRRGNHRLTLDCSR